MNNVSTSQTKTERQKHLNLNMPCLIRGGNSTSHKGILAQYLNTNIPSGRILLCHACHNAKCSSPLHLYWGTDKENVSDAIVDGKHNNIWQNMVNKYGLEEAKKMQARGNKSAGGKANKGKPKSPEHRKKISEAMKKKHLIPQLAEGHDLKS